jgi:hypothetical protein
MGGVARLATQPDQRGGEMSMRCAYYRFNA